MLTLQHFMLTSHLIMLTPNQFMLTGESSIQNHKWLHFAKAKCASAYKGAVRRGEWLFHLCART